MLSREESKKFFFCAGNRTQTCVEIVNLELTFIEWVDEQNSIKALYASKWGLQNCQMIQTELHQELSQKVKLSK